MKILYFGTPEFAVPALCALKNAGHEISGVITQPDKPQGRKMIMTPPPVKVYALTENIPVYQPISLKNNAITDVLEKTNPQIIVVAAYGKILPEYVLSYPEMGCVNIHGSLLPRWRGASPINAAIINGDKKTGITTMYMDSGIDTGDMIYKTETEIGQYETAGMLQSRLSQIGADLIIRTLSDIAAGNAPREKQDDGAATYAPMMDKQTGSIDWSASSDVIKNLIYGTNPWPYAYTTLENTTLKILEANLCEKNSSAVCGTVISADKNGIIVKTGDASIMLTQLQPQGKKIMSAAECVNGRVIKNGDKFTRG